MECQVCYGEVRDNWTECDCCGQIVCFNCCRHPASKFCVSCILKNNLTSDLIERGLITESHYEATTFPR